MMRTDGKVTVAGDIAYFSQVSSITGLVWSKANIPFIIEQLHFIGYELVPHPKSSTSLMCRLVTATIRENIIFGTKFDEDFYRRTIEACALQPDLAIMDKGEFTEVGEKGKPQFRL